MQGYVVVDLETTGVRPRLNDRIVEIAAIYVSPEGDIENSWTTLVNPERDMGPQGIHGVKAVDVLEAPTFDELIPWVMAVTNNRLMVAHQAAFDLGFLKAEFERYGLQFSNIYAKPLCTLNWSKAFLTGSSRTLASCCSEVDIVIENAHTAIGDANATAKLLKYYILETNDINMRTRKNRAVINDWEAQHRPMFTEQPHVRIPELFPALRGQGQEQTGSFMSKIINNLNASVGSEAEESYLSLLDRVLLDREISARETQDLVTEAYELGMNKEVCAKLNRQYLKEVIKTAWEDREITEEEKADIDKVAELLDVPSGEVDQMLEQGWFEVELKKETRQENQGRFFLEPGDLIVFTGDMTMPRDEWFDIIESMGFKPSNGVTKKVKLVVAADPDSLSVKARKAHDYKIPIMNEQGFKNLLKEI